MDDGVKTKGGGGGGCFVWQSILKACQVIALRSLWRIGDGHNVLIRGDGWLPGPHYNKVLSP